MSITDNIIFFSISQLFINKYLFEYIPDSKLLSVYTFFLYIGRNLYDWYMCLPICALCSEYFVFCILYRRGVSRMPKCINYVKVMCTKPSIKCVFQFTLQHFNSKSLCLFFFKNCYMYMYVAYRYIIL